MALKVFLLKLTSFRVYEVSGILRLGVAMLQNHTS